MKGWILEVEGHRLKTKRALACDRGAWIQHEDTLTTPKPGGRRREDTKTHEGRGSLLDGPSWLSVPFKKDIFSARAGVISGALTGVRKESIPTSAGGPGFLEAYLRR